jgi:hypothetical protein
MSGCLGPTARRLATESCTLCRNRRCAKVRLDQRGRRGRFQPIQKTGRKGQLQQLLREGVGCHFPAPENTGPADYNRPKVPRNYGREP